jgi:hypothetical protein
MVTRNLMQSNTDLMMSEVQHSTEQTKKGQSPPALEEAPTLTKRTPSGLSLVLMGGEIACEALVSPMVGKKQPVSPLSFPEVNDETLVSPFTLS